MLNFCACSLLPSGPLFVLHVELSACHTSFARSKTSEVARLVCCEGRNMGHNAGDSIELLHNRFLHADSEKETDAKESENREQRRRA